MSARTSLADRRSVERLEDAVDDGLHHAGRSTSANELRHAPRRRHVDRLARARCRTRSRRAWRGPGSRRRRRASDRVVRRLIADERAAARRAPGEAAEQVLRVDVTAASTGSPGLRPCVSRSRMRPSRACAAFHASSETIRRSGRSRSQPLRFGARGARPVLPSASRFRVLFHTTSPR